MSIDRHGRYSPLVRQSGEYYLYIIYKALSPLTDDGGRKGEYLSSERYSPLARLKSGEYHYIIFKVKEAAIDDYVTEGGKVVMAVYRHNRRSPGQCGGYYINPETKDPRL